MSTPEVDRAKDKARQIGDEAKDTAKQAADAARHEAASFAGQAKDRIESEVDTRKQQAAGNLGDVAGAVRQAADQLSETDHGAAGRMVRQAADSLESVTRTLKEKRPEEIADDLRDLARRNPTAFVAGSVLAGFAISRFFRASSHDAGRGEGTDFANRTATRRDATPMGVGQAAETPTSSAATGGLGARAITDTPVRETP